MLSEQLSLPTLLFLIYVPKPRKREREKENCGEKEEKEEELKKLSVILHLPEENPRIQS